MRCLRLGSKHTMRAKASGSSARAAHQRAVDVRLRHQGVDVVGLHRPTVLDPDRRPLRRPKRSCSWPRSEGVHVLGHLRGRGLAGPDRPDGLVGDDQLSGAGVRDLGQAAGELAADHVEACARPRAPRASRPRTRWGGCRGRRGPRALLGDEVVALAVEGAALAVADDRVAAAEVRQHGRVRSRR